LRKIFLLLMTLCLATAVLGADCSAARKSNDKLKGIITVAHYMSQKSKTVTFEKCQKLFTKMHPKVKFENTLVVQTNYFSFIRTKVAANDAPDIMMGQPSQYPDIIGTGIIMDFTDNPLLKKAALDRGDLGDCSYKGKVYGIPIDFKTYGVMYNVDIFKKFGLKEPKTHSELMKICEVLKKNGVDPWIRSYRDQVFPDIEIRGVLWPLLQKHGKFDAFGKLMSGAKQFSDYPEFKQAMMVWTDRLKYDRLDDLANDQNKANELFAAGKGAMYYTGTWNIGDITTKNPNLKMGIFKLPASDVIGDSKFPCQVDEVFMVNAKSKKAGLALKFMEFMLSTKAAKVWSEGAQMPSVVKGVKSDSLHPIVLKVMEEKAKGNIAHAGLWTAQMYGEYTIKWRAILQKYAAEKKWDINKLTGEMQATWDEIIKSSKK
jgi:raffinose/stachyose/melibiose transport system substrate-binding protein